MKKIFFLLIFGIVFQNIYAQQSSCHVMRPMSEAVKLQRKNGISTRSDWACARKVIALNFHFISNSTRGNFTASGDGLGNATTAYDYAHMIVERLNENLKENIKMNIPPGNNTQVMPKDYIFAIHSVNFQHNVNPTNMAQMRLNAGTNQNFQMDIILDNNVGGGQMGGWASTTDPFDKDRYCYMNTYGGYYEYIVTNRMTPSDALNLTLNRDLSTLNHELGHLLTLDHTVKYGSGSNCPTLKFGGAVDQTCDDDCWDTPTAWYMTDVLNAPIHPGESNPNSHPDFYKWFSNNRMEYTGYSSLSACQLIRIHNTLQSSNQMRSYLVSERVKTDNAICKFTDNVTSYYGKKVTLNKNCTALNQSIVFSKKYVKIHSHEMTEVFPGFEVKADGYFEVLDQCASW